MFPQNGKFILMYTVIRFLSRAKAPVPDEKTQKKRPALPYEAGTPNLLAVKQRAAGDLCAADPPSTGLSCHAGLTWQYFDAIVRVETGKPPIGKNKLMKKLTTALWVLDGLAESFYKNVLCDQVQPKPGSILKVDLALNPFASACHTGIYVGRNRIVEMTNDNGTGIIQKVSPQYFLNYSRWRTGVFIYVACVKKDGKYYPLAAPEIAERARKAVGDRTEYDPLLDNCHLFTEYCITGKHDSRIGTLESVEAALVRKFCVPKGAAVGKLLFSPVSGLISSGLIHWMSTGVASQDSFRND